MVSGRALILLPLVLTSSAWGFCRKTTCSTPINPPVECLTADSGAGDSGASGCDSRGTPLFWPKTCISFSAQYEGSPRWDILGSELEEIVTEAFDRWQWVECEGGRHPNIRVDTYPKVGCKEQRYNPSTRNQNVWFFQDERWPYEDHRLNDIAVTTLVFHRITGEIYDADVEFNSANYAFVLDSSGSRTAAGTALETDPVDFPRVDLPSIAQHESGHVLGFEDLPSSTGVDSMTMFPQYPGGTDWRDLDQDAIAAVCETYPPTDSPDLACVADPPHGFTPECVPDHGCTIAPGRSRGANRRWLAVCWLAAFGLSSAWRKRFL